MKPQQALDRFGKFINYILGYRPDGFGLVPDANGYVKIKDLLKAVTEEDGWKHIRRSQIDALLVTLADTPIEISGNLVRATDRERLSQPKITRELPKLLYTCVRRKAYPHVHRKGIFPTSQSKVVLTETQALAKRIGGRTDADPVLLTVQVQKTLDLGVMYYQAGDGLYLADAVPPDGFSGPPLPKEPVEEKKQPVKETRQRQNQPGTFSLDPESFAKKYRGKPDGRRRKEADWKKDRKRARKIKEKW